MSVDAARAQLHHEARQATSVERYSRHVYYDSDEGEFVALCGEFPHLAAFGDSATEALAELDIALEAAVEVHRDEGWPVPMPSAPPPVEPLPSGRFVARLPKTLHARLASAARQEGVSLNTLVITLLAAGLASYADAASCEGAREGRGIEAAPPQLT